MLRREVFEVFMDLTATGIFLLGVLCGTGLAFALPLIWQRAAPAGAQRKLTRVAAAVLFGVVAAAIFFSSPAMKKAWSRLSMTQGPAIRKRPSDKLMPKSEIR